MKNIFLIILLSINLAVFGSDNNNNNNNNNNNKGRSRSPKKPNINDIILKIND